MKSTADQLKTSRRIAARLHGHASQSVPVKETFGDKTVWEGVVHVFKFTVIPRPRSLCLVIPDRGKR